MGGSPGRRAAVDGAKGGGANNGNNPSIWTVDRDAKFKGVSTGLHLRAMPRIHRSSSPLKHRPREPPTGTACPLAASPVGPRRPCSSRTGAAVAPPPFGGTAGHQDFGREALGRNPCRRRRPTSQVGRPAPHRRPAVEHHAPRGREGFQGRQGTGAPPEC
jgi:hypothetical protein